MSTSTPTDFGRDLACAQSLSTTRTVTGNALVVNALIRRITTKRGTLHFHRNYGLDIRDLLGAGFGPGQLPRYESALRDECAEDPRLLDVAVTLTEVAGANGSTITIAITAETAFGPFDFVVTVDKVTLAILRIDTGAA